jgi:hypothetical protein
MPKVTRGYPVYPCTRSELDEKPIGRAESPHQAARLINRYLEGRDGDNYALTEDDITFGSEPSGFFIAE